MTTSIANLDLSGSQGIVGNSGYSASLPYPPQNAIWNDGLHTYVYYHSSATGTATTPKVSIGSTSVGVFTENDVPYLSTSARGYGLSSWYTLHQTWKVLVAAEAYTSNGKTVNIYKNDDDYGITKMASPYEGAPSSAKHFPSIIVDKGDHYWIAGRTGTSPYYIKATRSTDAFEQDAWDTTDSLATLTDASGMPQLIPYSNGDIGILYSDNDDDLYYRHWIESTDTWESAQTVATNDLASYINYRGVVTRNDQLYVVWKTTTNSTIKYRIRDRSAGTWNTTANIVTDADNALYGFITAADVGQDEKVYLFYLDSSANVVYRDIQGATVSGKTTFITSPALRTKIFIATYADHETLTFGYHESVNDNIIVKNLDITPTRKSTEGTLITLDGSTNNSLSIIGQHMVSKGDKTLVMWTGKDSRPYLRVYDTSAGTWDQDAVPFAKRYWDYHNTMTVFIDDTGYVYLSFGGRDANGTTEYIEVWKSEYILDSAFFTLDKINDWTDISPTNVTGRGYKLVIVDNFGIPHLFDVSTMGPNYAGCGPIRVREYRSSTWSSATNIVDTCDAPSPYDHTYVSGLTLGNEASGQKSIHMTWTYMDKSVQPAATGGAILQNEINYVRVVPQGTGSYKAYAADGTEFVKGADLSLSNIFRKDTVYSGEAVGGNNTYEVYTVKTYSVDDYVLPTGGGNGHVCKVIVGGAASVEPAWPTNHYDTVVDGAVTFQEYGKVGSDWVRVIGAETSVINNTTPVVMQTRCSSTSPNEISEILFTKWDGTNWVTSSVETLGFPWITVPKIVVGTEGIFIVMQKEVNGVSEIVYYTSTDEGDTWDSGTYITTGSSFDNYYPLVSPRSSTVQNLIYMTRLHDSYSEVMFTELVISKGGTPGIFNAPFNNMPYSLGGDYETFAHHFDMFDWTYNGTEPHQQQGGYIRGEVQHRTMAPRRPL